VEKLQEPTEERAFSKPMASVAVASNAVSSVFF